MQDKLGDKTGALEDFQRAAAVEHCNTDVLFNLALALFQNGVQKRERERGRERERSRERKRSKGSN